MVVMMVAIQEEMESNSRGEIGDEVNSVVERLCWAHRSIVVALGVRQCRLDRKLQPYLGCYFFVHFPPWNVTQLHVCLLRVPNPSQWDAVVESEWFPSLLSRRNSVRPVNQILLSRLPVNINVRTRTLLSSWQIAVGFGSKPNALSPTF
jgi:hypothetical protein